MIVIRDAGYRDELARLTPGLRAFTRALIEGHAVDAADEIVQTVLLDALNVGSERRGIRLRLWLLSGALATHRRVLREATVDRQAGARHRAAQQAVAQTGQWDVPRRPSVRDTAMLDDMPLEWRETLLLVALENLSYAQVAECLGATLTTVIGNLAKAREHLARKGVGAASPREPASSRTVPYLRVVK